MTKDSKKKKMGCLAKALIWLVIILVVLGVFIQFGLDNAIQWSVNQLGPKVLGVDTSVQRVYLSPIQGRVTLEGLHVGNPDGFHTDGIFDLAKVDVDLSMRSLFSDPIVVRHVVVDGMEVTYEQGLLHSNVGTLIDNLSGEEKPDEEKPEEPKEEKDEGEGRKLIIEKFSLANSKVRVAMTGMMGLGLPIPLPSMELEGIGAKSGGATGKDVALELLKDIGGLVTGTVAGVGGAVVDGAKAVGGAVADGAGVAVDAVSEGAKAVGGAVADGAGVAVDAVSDGAKALAGVFGFGGDDEEAAPASEEQPAEELAEAAEPAEPAEDVAEPVEAPAEPAEPAEKSAESVQESIDSAVDAVSDGAKAIGGTIVGMLGLGSDKAEDASESEEQPAAESAEPAEKPAESVQKSIDTTVDAVSDSAKAVGGAIAGMLGFGSDKAEEPAAE